MVKLSHDLFFDLTNFAHSELFQHTSQVWDVLGKTIHQYLLAHIDLTVNVIRGTVMEGAILIGSGIVIEEGAVVEPTAYIKGPAIIGKGTEVRHGAYVRGDVITGENCVIGHATEVKNAIFLNDAKAGHFAYVGDSVLGNHVNLGAGTKLANLKMIEGNVMVRLNELRIDSGLRKFGSILGDYVEMGCNSVANPGTLLAPRSIVYPCCSARGASTESRIIK